MTGDRGLAAQDQLALNSIFQKHLASLGFLSTLLSGDLRREKGRTASRQVKQRVKRCVSRKCVCIQSTPDPMFLRKHDANNELETQPTNVVAFSLL